jgi:hypothetical protein
MAETRSGTCPECGLERVEIINGELVHHLRPNVPLETPGAGCGHPIDEREKFRRACIDRSETPEWEWREETGMPWMR